MSILIKGMKMPKTCDECDFNYDAFRCILPIKDNEFFSNGNYLETDRLPNCPLIELPAEHGRLIDADALTVSNGWVAEAENYRTHITFIYEYDIVNAPTIIEAEGVDG